MGCDVYLAASAAYDDRTVPDVIHGQIVDCPRIPFEVDDIGNLYRNRQP